MSVFIVYILRCQNESLYTGYTTDLTRRYAAHIAGKCKYTRSFKPIHIAVHWWVYGDKSDAMRVERYIKSLSRLEKERLLQTPNTLTTTFSFVQVAKGDDDVSTS